MNGGWIAFWFDLRSNGFGFVKRFLVTGFDLCGLSCDVLEVVTLVRLMV